MWSSSSYRKTSTIFYITLSFLKVFIDWRQKILEPKQLITQLFGVYFFLPSTKQNKKKENLYEKWNETEKIHRYLVFFLVCGFHHHHHHHGQLAELNKSVKWNFWNTLTIRDLFWLDSCVCLFVCVESRQQQQQRKDSGLSRSVSFCFVFSFVIFVCVCFVTRIFSSESNFIVKQKKFRMFQVYVCRNSRNFFESNMYK